MNIHYSKAELMKLRSRIQNPFFFKNYFRWGNVKFYLALLGTVLGKPSLLLDMGRRIAKTGRLEVLAEGIFAEYQRRKLTEKKAPNFFAKIS
ncbi:MAG: hypothetical protein HYU64_18735 [Armatimonadetes bacterium]|nr:hypothetical protein [Armatimonadota bacterium]